MGLVDVSVLREANYWNIPHFMYNKNIVGRDLFIKHLSDLLNRKTENRVIAVYGMAGIGKSQVIYEYIESRKHQYNLIYWMNAEDKDLLVKEFIDLGEKLALPIGYSDDIQTNLGLIKNWLCDNENWLLVFDNMEDTKLLGQFLPGRFGGSIVLTSRNPNWKHIADPVELELLDPSYSVSFLLRRTGSEESEDANKLARLLGNLPLALEQAAAYIESTSITISQYNKQFEKHSTKLLQYQKAINYNYSFVAVTELTLERISEKDSTILELLQIFSFMDPNNIPRSLFIQDNEDGEPIYLDELDLNIYVAEMRRYSIIKITNDAISIHRLVQEVIMNGLSEAVTRARLNRCLDLMVEFVSRKFNSEIDLVVCGEQIAPSIMAVISPVHRRLEFPKQIVSLMNFVGEYFLYCTHYEKAESIFKEAIGICDARKDLAPQFMAELLSGLAFAYYRMGDYIQSEEYYLQALKHVSETSPDETMLAVYNHYGILLMKSSRFMEARYYLLQAVRISRTLFGKKAIFTVNIAGNYAELLVTLDRFKDAEKRLHANIEILKVLVGDKHPSIAATYSLLGYANRQQGNYNKEIEYCRLALQIDEELFHDNHPQLALDNSNLGLALINIGSCKEGLVHLKKSYRIDGMYLGNRHPKIATRLNNLGQAYSKMNKPKRAIVFYRRALEINCSVHMNGSIEIATQLANIGMCYQSLNRTSEAIDYLERALAMDKKFYKSRSTELAKDYLNLAASYAYSKVPFYLDKAEDYIIKAIRIYELRHGRNHFTFQLAVDLLLQLYLFRNDRISYLKAKERYVIG